MHEHVDKRNFSKIQLDSLSLVEDTLEGRELFGSHYEHQSLTLSFRVRSILENPKVEFIVTRKDMRKEFIEVTIFNNLVEAVNKFNSYC